MTTPRHGGPGSPGHRRSSSALPDRPIAGLIDAALADDPDATALIGPDGVGQRSALTYAELDDAVARRASGLVEVLHGDRRVGVVAARQVDLVVTVLALLRLGVAYVPLDPGAPDRRWEQTLDIAGARVVVGPRSVCDERGVLAARIAFAAWEDLDAPPVDLPSPPPSSGPTEAYVLFTSGTTGTPKGVVVGQRNLAVRLEQHRTFHRRPPRSLVQTTLAFDASLPPLLVPLSMGGSVVLADDAHAADPALAARLVRDEGVTHVDAVPSWYSTMLDLAPPGALDDLDVVILGAEVLPPALVASHQRRVRARLVNDYGPTEATISATSFEVPPGWHGDRVPIGRPHVHTTVHVVDEDGEPCADGEVGELWIGGEGVALGYVGRPDDPAFRPEPWTGGPCYRTGDLASRRPDGLLELHGRADRQVKIRGQRVEPDETERVLLGPDFDDVGHAAVEVDRSSGRPRLVAYVAPRTHATLDSQDISTRLAAVLPPAQRPDAVIVLDALPLTAGGKVDRTALPSPGPLGDVSAGGPGRDPLERAVAAAIGEVLGHDEVGRDADFVVLGGDSLAAARVVARLRRAHAVDLRPEDLREARTPAALAALATSRPRREPDTDAPRRAVRDAAVAHTGPATDAQASFWFLEHEAGRPGRANLVDVVRIDGATAHDVERAASVLLGRHAGLRTGIEARAEAIVQVVHPATQLTLPVEQGIDPDDADGVRRFASRPFEMDAPPLARIAVRADDGGVDVVLVVHHAVADGRAMETLLAELVALVRDPAAGLPVPALDPLDLQEWLEDRIGADGQEALGHWAERLRLADETKGLVLPYDRRPRVDEPLDPSTTRVHLDADARDRLREVADATGVSLFSVLLSGLSLALRRLGAPDRFTVGTATANRPLPELESLVATTANVVPLVLAPDAEGRVPDLLRAVDAEARAAARWCWFPLERALLAEPRARSGHLVDVVVSMLNYAPAPDVVRLGAPPAELALTDLSIEILPRPDGVDLTVVHRRGRLTDRTVAALVDRWTGLLAMIAARPDAPVADLLQPTSTDLAEARRLGGNPGPAPTGSVMDMVEPHLLAGGARPAAVVGDRQVSWGELADLVPRIAAALRDRGVEPGDRVVLALDGVDAVIALLATWWIGAVAVPQGERQPDTRIAEIEERTTARLVLRPADVDELRRSARDLDPLPRRVLGVDETAYVLFTSGSTGRPKGVVISHGALRASTDARLRWYPDAPVSCLQLHDMAFDAAMGTTAWYLAIGGTLHMVPHEERLDLSHLVELVEQHGIGKIALVPSHHRALLQSADAGRMPSVRLVAMGGEVVTPALVALHRTVLPAAELVNEYGPTECTVWTIAHSCTADDLTRDVVPIGRPIAGTVVRVADPDGRPVPRGATGELLLGGHLLAEGYLDDPEQTARRFVQVDGARWYRTGDRARWSSTDELEFHGRVDEQMKVRGYRIEPGEIEHVLVEEETVVRAKVGTAELTPGAPVLVAWVQAAEGEEISTRDLVGVCRSRLPDWMVPARVVVVDEMPLTTSGKVDRHRLPVPPAAADDDVEPPATTTEHTVADVWADLLGRTPGVTEDFFAVGGHSLLAAQMAVRVRAVTGAPLALRDVLEEPTIRAIAALVDAAFDPSAAVDAAGLPDGDDVRRRWPLAPNQARLWYLTQLDETGDAYHMTRVARVVGRLDPEALAAALEEMGRRHPWLRSTIEVVDGTPTQLVHDEPVVGLSTPPPGPDAVAWAEDLVARRFDLDREPPWRVGLATEPDGRQVLATVVHHVISDATADATFVDELSGLYAAAVGGHEIAPSRAAHPGRVARDLDHARSDPARRAAVDAWVQDLAGIDVTARVPVSDDADTTDRRTGEIEQRLEPTLAALLQKVADERASTPFALSAAAIGAVSARALGVQDLVVGAPIDLRWRTPDATRTIAFLVETGMIPLRDPVGSPLAATAADLRRRVTDLLDTALPLDAVVAELRRRGDLPTHGDPLQIYVGWIDRPAVHERPRFGRDGTTLDVLADEPRSPMFDLSWTFVRDPEGIVLRLDVDLARVGRRSAERLVAHAVHVLDRALAEPDRPISELPPLPDSQLQEVLGWEGQVPAEPARPLVPSLWAAIVERDATVRFPTAAGTIAVSGRDLLDRAEAVASSLIAAGIAPGSAVAVGSERGIAMVAAVLGVLRAGCAFVPIDATHPVDRRRLLADDVDARAVVGTRDWILDLADHRGIPAVRLDDDGRPTTPAPPPSHWPERRGDDRAYVLFTSGSTGTPKGVVITDDALRARLDSFRADYGAASRFVHQSALGFDASIFMFWVLDTGGTLLVAPDDVAGDPAGLGRLIAEEGGDSFFMVPTMYRLLLDAAPEAVAGMAQVLIGGEELLPQLVARHAEVAPDVRLVNVYGPTETVVTSTCARIDPALHGGGAVPIPIGRPHPGTLVRVVDRHGGRVGVGAPGELLIGGRAVGVGYHGRDDLTAAAFTVEDGMRWYRTGDHVRWTEDGELVFLGRMDRQVKLRGQRIELSEVEHALLGLDGVEDALVAVDGTGVAARLVALVSPVTGRTSSATRAELGTTLPRAWIPSVLVEVDAIPRTLGDKLDRRALPALLARAGPEPTDEADRETSAPVDATIAAVAAAMGELLERPPVGPDEDFFDIGGHSLLAARLITMLAERIGATVRLGDMMDAATPRSLTSVIERRSARDWAEASEGATIEVLRDGDLAPLVIVARDGETSMYLRHVLRDLDERRPLWLVLRSAPPIRARAFDIEAQGREVAAALRATGIDTAHLLGHSASGLVALEAATSLGARVDTLTLLDTVRPNARDDVVRAPVRDLRLWLSDARGEWRSFVETRRSARAVRRSRAEPQDIRRVRDLQDVRGVGRHRGRPVDRPIALLAAAGTQRAWGPDLGWSRWCDDLRIHTLPSDHFGVLLPPHVEHTVAALGGILDGRP